MLELDRLPDLVARERDRTDIRVFFERDADPAKEAAHHRGGSGYNRIRLPARINTRTGDAHSGQLARHQTEVAD
jgi:hypothetical protein